MSKTPKTPTTPGNGVPSSDLFGWELLHAAARWILDPPTDWDYDDIPSEVVAYWSKVRATLKAHRDEHGDPSHSLAKHAGIILATHYKHTFEPEPNRLAEQRGSNDGGTTP